MVPRRRFSLEFRQKALRLVEEENLTTAEAARQLAMSQKSLGNWVRAARRPGTPVIPPAPLSPTVTTVEAMQVLVLQLQADNARLRMEKEILRKATALMAKEYD
jgi:transposase